MAANISSYQFKRKKHVLLCQLAGGALRTGLLHTLITDEHTARQLLSL